MSEEFDAYYKWLGIPPKDQPPNHYRLLGIELFEENPDVIEASAERQATYLHEVSAGSNVKESQLLLNEVAAARLCLLGPEKKAAYDAKLESKVTASVTVEALSGASPLDNLPWDNLEDSMTGDPALATTAKGQGPSDTLPLPAPNSSGVFSVPQSLAAPKQDASEARIQSSGIPVLWLAIGGGVALLVLIAVIAIVVLSSGSDDGPNLSSVKQPDKPKKDDAVKNDDTVKKDRNREKPVVVAEAKRVELTGTFKEQKALEVQFIDEDGTKYNIVKKHREEASKFIGEKVDIVAKVKPGKIEGNTLIVYLGKITPASDSP